MSELPLELVGAPCSLYHEYCLRVERKSNAVMREPTWLAVSNWLESEGELARRDADQLSCRGIRSRVIRIRFEVCAEYWPDKATEVKP